MIKKSILYASIIFLTSLSCTSITTHDRLMTGTIIKDCTGTYIKDQTTQLDYLVCNDDLLKDKTQNSTIQVIYDFTKECKAHQGKIICMMYHEHKGVISIKSIK